MKKAKRKTRIASFFRGALVITLLFKFAESEAQAQPAGNTQEKAAGLSNASPTAAPSLSAIFRTPIDLEGVVLDQSGEPVAGAKVEYTVVNSLSIGSRPPKDGGSTSSDGRFRISGERGSNISVRVTHPEYMEMGESHGSYPFYVNPADINPKLPPKKGEPVVLRLFKRSKAEPLRRVRGSSILLPTDGTKVTLAIKRRVVKSDKGGEIEVECEADPKLYAAERFVPFPWKCRISIPGGGLIQRKETEGLEAPIDGYVDSDVIEMASVDQKDWVRTKTRSYFVRLPDGLFARIDFSVAMGERPFISVDAYINPSGSRNLVYDETKEIEDE